jgi:hypothetical protein
MKTVILVLLSVFLVLGCVRGNSESEPVDSIYTMQQVPAVLNNFYLNGLKVPDGSKAEYSGSRLLEIRFPAGIYLVSKAPSGKLSLLSDKKYQCTCTGEGCNVIAFPGNEGWEVGCSSCNSTCTGKWIEDEIVQESDEFLGFVDLDQGVAFAAESDVYMDAPDANYIFEIPELQKEYDRFLAANGLQYESEKASEKQQTVYVNAFGTLISLNVPESTIKEKFKGNSFIISSTGSPSCSCDTGDTGCQLNEITRKLCGVCPEITVGYQCLSGGCVSCTMAIPVQE